MTNSKQPMHELDPVARAIANAPIDDEPENELEKAKVLESKTWLESGGKPLSHEELLADFALTPNHFENDQENRP
jgi:hypothetical protein